MKKRCLLLTVGLMTVCLSLFSACETHRHTFGDWTAVRTASCTDDGLEECTCACGEIEMRNIPATGHTYVDTVVPPTETEQGYTEHTCSACQDSYRDTFADPTASQGLSYTLNSDGDSYIVTGIGSCGDSKLIIPSEYNGKPVTVIGEHAFMGCASLMDVTIPNSVISIGCGAFEDCTGLRSITIPFVGATKDGETNTHFGYIFGADEIIDNGNYVPWRLMTVVVTGGSRIHNSAFFNCSSIQSITIPDSVTSIGNSAFYDCRSLYNITIPDSVTSIGITAFDKTSYYNSSSNWEKDVLYIGKHLIQAKITISDSYSIKQGCVTIADEAFDYCFGLTSITIPDSVTSIGRSAFSDCVSLSSITVANGNPVYHSVDNCLIETETKTLLVGCNKSIIPTDGSVTSIGDYSFSGSHLQSVTIPDGVTSIGNAAFYNCTFLNSVTIPESVTFIGKNAFRNCKNLERLELPKNITFIGNYSFSGCKSLTSITIPDGITSIGDHAFSECTCLTSITIPDSVTSIGDLVFYKCRGLTSIAFTGTTAQWSEINKDSAWNFGANDAIVYCTDGVAED